MKNHELKEIIESLIAQKRETEIVEFKSNLNDPKDIAKYICGLGNTLILEQSDNAWITWGIDDKSFKITGTTFNPFTKKWAGNQDFIIGLTQNINPRPDFQFFECDYDGKKIILLKINCPSSPLDTNSGIRYIRVGSNLVSLKDHPDKEKRIFENLQKPKEDWSAQIVYEATVGDLCQNAIDFVRHKFRKHLEIKKSLDFNQIDSWDDLTLLNKTGITIKGKITNCALLLLGKEESKHFLGSTDAKISWRLWNNINVIRSHEHFMIPFISAIDQVFQKIRNLYIQYMPNNTLFPDTVLQYDEWVMREILHNAIVHQDYYRNGRIIIDEYDDKLVFCNIAEFIPETIENLLQTNAPPEKYRNKFLVDVMIKVGMVEQNGSGIWNSFQKQRERFFPLPDYDTTNKKVKVTIYGKIIDIEYVKALMIHKKLDFFDIIALDKVQKKIQIDKNLFNELKAKKLIEGRYPNAYISSEVAKLTNQKAEYIKNRPLDDKFYEELIITHIKKFKSALRPEIDTLLLNKLSDSLDKKQKKGKISNLLTNLRKKEIIYNCGSDSKSKWVLVEKFKRDLKEI